MGVRRAPGPGAAGAAGAAGARGGYMQARRAAKELSLAVTPHLGYSVIGDIHSNPLGETRAEV